MQKIKELRENCGRRKSFGIRRSEGVRDVRMLKGLRARFL
jgi:hypothetical protein